jgi:hypothetical protein
MRHPRLDEPAAWYQFAPIVQRVLSNLEWRDLLRMEAVCRTWRASHASSSEELVVKHMSSSFEDWLENTGNRLINVAVER